MAPFFGHDRRQFAHQFDLIGIALDERHAKGRRFLFAIGMIGQDLSEVHFRQVDPTRVGWQFESQDALGGFR